MHDIILYIINIVVLGQHYSFELMELSEYLCTVSHSYSTFYMTVDMDLCRKV